MNLLRADLEEDFAADPDTRGLGYIHFSPKVGEDFRSATLDLVPGASADTPDGRFIRNLIGYAALPRWVSRSRGIPIPSQTIANLDGRTRRHDDSGLKLKQFEERTGIELGISTWSFQEGRAREIRPIWPPQFESAIAAEIVLSGTHRSRVYLDDGQSCHRSQRAEQERADFLAMRNNFARMVSYDDPRRYSLGILNSQSKRVSKHIIEQNRDATLETIQSIPDDRDRARNLSIFGEVLDRPFMAYHPCSASSRLYGVTRCLNDFSNKQYHVRDAVLCGCSGLDLKAAQLRVIAVMWNLPSLTERLDDDDFWTTFLSDVGLFSDLKPVIKSAIYSCSYGASRTTIKNNYVDDLVKKYQLSNMAASASADRFLSHDISLSLFSARDRRMNEIAAAGGVRTAFGTWVAVSPRQPGKDGWKKHEAEKRSALAQEIQGFEQMLMIPALDVAAARQEQGLCVVSYLHDGLTIHYRDSSRIRTILCEMEKAITNNASQHGFRINVEKKIPYQ